MRQAIVIKNPKWERFTVASDAFKSLTLKDGETAVLAIRGRCKEKKTPKVYKVEDKTPKKETR